VDYRTPNIYDPSTLTEPYAYARANPTMFWDPNGLSTRTEGNIRIITFKLDGTRAEFEVDDQIWQQVLFGQRKWGDFGFEGAPKDGYEIHQRSQEFEEYLIVQHLKHEHLFENSKYERISGLETIGRDVAIGLYASVFAPYIGVATILGAFSPTSIIFAKYMGGSIAASYLLTQAVVIPTDAIQGTNDAEKVADAYSEIVLPVFASQYLGIAFQEGLGPGVTFYATASRSPNIAPNNAGKLTFDRGTNSWVSQEGLVYGQGSAHGNRVKHVLDHTVPNPNKPVHSVFSVDRTQVIGLLDEAWAGRIGPGTLQPNGNRVWIVDMGREVGTAGQRSVQIVVRDGTKNIITAFPK